MTTLYLDLASNRFPGQGSGPDDLIHCTRVAALIAGEPAFVALIKPNGWSLTDSVAPYLKADEAELAGGMDVIDAAHKLAKMVKHVDEIAAYNVPFHQRAFMALFIDAQAEIPTRPWRCLMDLATPVVRTKLISAGRRKSPKLGEAFAYFAGSPLVGHMDWEKHGLQQVMALRAIDNGIRRGEAA